MHWRRLIDMALLLKNGSAIFYEQRRICICHERQNQQAQM
jgi:hypothetical protein